MKALVTGANGFTGSHLCQYLLQRGDQVTAYVRQTSDLSRLEGLAVEFAYGQITDQASLAAAMEGADTVFHTAAYVELGLVDADLMERVNVEGTKDCLSSSSGSGRN